MKRALVLGVFLIAASGSAASAGTYLGAGIGTNGFSDSLHIFSSDGRAGRLFLGYRFPSFSVGALSLEGGIEGFGLFDNVSRSKDWTGTDLFAAGKFSLPFASDFEAFGRLGVQHSSVSGPTDSFDGSGYLFGAGIEFRFTTGVIGSGSLFVDFTRNAQKMTEANQSFDASSDRWMLGATIGF